MTGKDTWPEDPNTQSPTPAKKSSGCGKVILIVGGLMFLLMLVCGGGIGFFAYSFWPKIATQPAEVAAISKEILDLDIPEGFVPENAISMNNFMMTMRMATYRHPDGKGDLMLGNFQVKVGKPDQSQKPDFSGSDNKSKKLTIGETEIKEFPVRGKQVPFRFSDAVDEESNEKYRVVEAEFGDAGVTTFLKLSVPEDSYDEEAVVKMIESIR
ncbi:MAG: hypothetical protein JWP89_1668 [Schlesneria sp.]|nr:hypothetical protein [Schlesneria sp.]